MKESVIIRPAAKEHVDDIVRLIMTAMTDDCCLYYAGEGRTLDDFARVLRRLVLEERSQYSYRNTLIALIVNEKSTTGDERRACIGNAAKRPAVDEKDIVAGICVAYDGSMLHSLREAFFKACKEEIDREFETFADETGPGEYYVDSLAVYPRYRRRGIASSLLGAMAERARAAGLPLGLLVDKTNPDAERMYTAIGFEYVGDSMWGGHPMKHLVMPPVSH